MKHRGTIGKRPTKTGFWNGTPKAPHRPTNTANKTATPIRGGMGATRSLDWYRRND